MSLLSVQLLRIFVTSSVTPCTIRGLESEYPYQATHSALVVVTAFLTAFQSEPQHGTRDSEALSYFLYLRLTSTVNFTLFQVSVDVACR